MRTIIDVGAAALENTNPNDTYYLFEPEQEAFNELKTRFKNNNRIHIFDIGLYDYKGSADLYVAKKRQCSSLLPPNMEVLMKWNAIRFTTEFTTKIQVDRLDNIISIDDPGIIDLLKIDTQGTEYEVLKGCGEILHKVKTINCEVEHIELYKNQKLFGDVTTYLKTFGFKFYKWECEIRWAGDLIFGNAIYKNTNLL